MVNTGLIQTNATSRSSTLSIKSAVLSYKRINFTSWQRSLECCCTTNP